MTIIKTHVYNQFNFYRYEDGDLGIIRDGEGEGRKFPIEKMISYINSHLWVKDMGSGHRTREFHEAFASFIRGSEKSVL